MVRLNLEINNNVILFLYDNSKINLIRNIVKEIRIKYEYIFIKITMKLKYIFWKYGMKNEHKYQS